MCREAHDLRNFTKKLVKNQNYESGQLAKFSFIQVILVMTIVLNDRIRDRIMNIVKTTHVPLTKSHRNYATRVDPQPSSNRGADPKSWSETARLRGR